MIFKCNNCGGIMVYSPEKEAMYCEHCGSIDSQSVITSENMSSCVNCGAPMEITDYTSATKCHHCGCYTIFEERVSGQYTPHLVLPFKISKEKAKEIIKEHAKKNIFVPYSYYSDSYVDTVSGMYVPFWMYDYDANYDYHGTGKKIRTWTSGNKQYTETKVFDVHRNMDIDFDKLPVDASIKMKDDVMDLMEPYDYKALTAFAPLYMSGFDGEVYNFTPEQLEGRAREKATRYSEKLMNDTLAGYSSITPINKNLNLQPSGTNYSLLPVWQYNYYYNGKIYDFYVNGQTGKIVGELPTSGKLKLLYFLVACGLFTAASYLLWMLLEVL